MVIYRSTQTVMVGGVKVFVGDELKIIGDKLWIMTSHTPFGFAIDPKKKFPYGNWKKMLEEIDEPPGDSEEGS